VEQHRRILRLAALLHDIGHLPFSHTSERLCTEGRRGHESYTEDLMRQGWLAGLLAHCPVHVDVRDVVSVALGRAASHADRADLSHHKAQVLSDMIAGDLGADRMDYLLRDAHHTGAAYGRFDIERLIHTLRLTHDAAGNPMYAIEEGGVHAAEGLILARYFMFEQVYYHHVRRAYDLHLADFLTTWLPDGVFPVALDKFLSLQDSDVHVAMQQAAADARNPGHDSARRIVERDHLRLAYEVRPEDEGSLVGLFDSIRDELCKSATNLLFDDLEREETTLKIPYVDREGNPGKVEERSGVSSLLTFPHRRVFAPREDIKEIRSRCENIAAQLREARDGQD
jgi:HD superfamily phosphohydrolase